MKEHIMFDDMWDSLKNKDPDSKIVFEEAEDISRVIVELIEARVAFGLTQRQLAEKTGLKQSAIARMESLKAIPRLDTIVKIARALQLRVCVDHVSAQINAITSYDLLNNNYAANVYQYYTNESNSNYLNIGVSNGIAG